MPASRRRFNTPLLAALAARPSIAQGRPELALQWDVLSGAPSHARSALDRIARRGSHAVAAGLIAALNLAGDREDGIVRTLRVIARESRARHRLTGGLWPARSPAADQSLRSARW